jgi:L-rhamnose mutarotase
MDRMGHVIQLNGNIIGEYKKIHAAVWPAVLKAISESNIRNYSIFLKEPENLLFAYWEYHGEDFAADMAKMKLVPEMLEWWKITDPMQVPFETRKSGEWWARMENVFHTD